ncbi:AAA family ATPase [Acetobacterium paludosum]|uniref:AAA family ATPase n=1 Tax=Acetobacterium paludosum TaxID=52693 RepID=A0A923KR96_9FIRM|nr:ATP-binding protein [Acetobacterium paludosum]MBC3887017.1 AAA family ATPase [Acetobacterium paludosum]
MKQLLILSGKGGTGKTTVASAFIKAAGAKAYADCDVDAPNLHLVLGQTSQPKRTDFYGMPKAEINSDLCAKCDRCRENCRFDAVSVVNDAYHIDPYACEGCGVCQVVCPVRAITLKPNIAGELMLYSSDTVFSTAQLKMGSGTSGMLVTEVKKQMKSVDVKADLAIIDGSPGIGCPVIASLSGVDMVLIVAEPSVSGISDMERIIKTAQTFHTKIAVCVNKCDTNMKNTEKIKLYCDQMNLPYTGNIPYDEDAVKAINNGQTIVDVYCEAGNAVREVINNTMQVLLNK